MGAIVNQQGEVIGETAGSDKTVTVVHDTTPSVTTANSIETEVANGIKALRPFANRNAIKLNTRSVEKLLVYGAGIVAATNGFSALTMPNTVRGVLLAASAGVIAALHVSG